MTFQILYLPISQRIFRRFEHKPLTFTTRDQAQRYIDTKQAEKAARRMEPNPELKILPDFFEIIEVSTSA